MLPGWTARQWGRPLKALGVGLLTFTWGGGAAYFLIGATAETVPLWLYVIFALAVLTFLAVWFTYFAAMIKAIREAKAGYTTTGGMYPELPQLDSKTGDVIREAGAARPQR